MILELIVALLTFYIILYIFKVPYTTKRINRSSHERKIYFPKNERYDNLDDSSFANEVWMLEDRQSIPSINNLSI